MSQWRSKQLAALGKWAGLFTIFFMMFDLLIPSDFAAPMAFIITLLAIMHPENKPDRDAIKLPVIDIILEK